MSKYIDAEKLKERLEEMKITEYEKCGVVNLKTIALQEVQELIDSLQQEHSYDQPEYGYLSTEYVYGKKSWWNVGDVLAYYISTSNEEGEYLIGKVVNVEFDEEEGWVYTFEDESTWDEQSLVEERAYKIIEK